LRRALAVARHSSVSPVISRDPQAARWALALALPARRRPAALTARARPAALAGWAAGAGGGGGAGSRGGGRRGTPGGAQGDAQGGVRSPAPRAGARTGGTTPGTATIADPTAHGDRYHVRAGAGGDAEITEVAPATVSAGGLAARVATIGGTVGMRTVENIGR